VSNKGVFSGATVGSGQWRNYDPLWLNTNQSGTPTMPDIGNGTKQGRYLKLTGGLVVAQVQLIFGSTTTFGNGDFYTIGLPFPANRWTATLGSTVADLPIGTALAWQGSAASPSLTMPLLPTLADPGGGYGTQTNEDYFAHLFYPHALAVGTSSVTNAGPATVTHNLGLTPVASDITITPTAITASSTNPKIVYVDTIGATTFNVNVLTALGSGKTLSFSWKARAEPNNSAVNFPQLVSYRRPWTWAQNHGIYCQFIYEARF
jgi:hypothetical protein